MPATPCAPLPAHAGRCLLIADFLDAAECAALVAASERRGYTDAATDYPPSYRNNDRHVVDSAALATRLAERLRPHAPATLDADGTAWHYAGINERIRFCRYRPGQRFNVHRDGVHHRGPGYRSHLTLLVYLADGAAFAGGDTVFYTHGPEGADGGAPRELGRVRPRAGSLLLFDHAIWHAGLEVTAGTKHVLRSDVMYRAASAGRAAGGETGHDGYVWALAGLDDGWTASAGRDATIRLTDAGGVPVRQLRGHERSVLGLAPLPGRRIASVSRDRTLRVWNWSTGACDTCVTAHDTAVLDVLALPGGRLATGAADGLVKLWREDGRALGGLAGHAGWVWQLAPLDDGRIASASEDGRVCIWDVASMRCSAVLEGDRPLRTLLVLDGAVWTGDDAGHITCWTSNGSRWLPAARYRGHRGAVRRLRRVGAGLVASCGEDRALRVWSVDRPRVLFEAWHEDFVTDALRRGDSILSSSYDGRIRCHAGALPRT